MQNITRLGALLIAGILAVGTLLQPVLGYFDPAADGPGCGLFVQTNDSNSLPDDIFTSSKTFELTVRNDNQTDNFIVDRVIVEWADRSEATDIELTEVQINDVSMWSGNDTTPNTDTVIEPGTKTVLNVDGFGAETALTVEFSSFPNAFMSLRDMDQTTMVVRDPGTDKSCNIIWDFSDASDELANFGVEGPPSPEDCVVENVDVLAADPFFYDDAVKFTITNNSTDTDFALVDFAINWRAHAYRVQDVDLRLERILVGGTGPKSPDADHIWVADGIGGVAIQPNGGTYMPYPGVPDITYLDFDPITKADGNWLVDSRGLAIGRGVTIDVWVDFNQSDLSGETVGLSSSDLNSTTFTFLDTSCNSLDPSPTDSFDYYEFPATQTFFDSESVPDAQDDFYEIFEDEVLTVTNANGPLVNDRDSNGGSNIQIVVYNGTLPCADTNLTWNNDGTFTYDPTTDPCITSLGDGQEVVIPISYTIAQLEGPILGQRDRATVYVTVKGKGSLAENAPPTARSRVASTIEETPIDNHSGNNLVSFATDPDGDPIRVASVTSPDGVQATFSLTSDGAKVISDAYGTLEVWPNGDWAYDPLTGSFWENLYSGDEHIVEYRFRLTDAPTLLGRTPAQSDEQKLEITVFGSGFIQFVPSPPSNGRIDFTPLDPVPGDTLTITVHDLDANSSISFNRVDVTVQNTTTGGTTEIITLTETDAVTGVFQGVLNTVNAPGDDGLMNGTINVEGGATLLITYDDVSNPGGTPLVRTRTVSFTGESDGPSDTLPPVITLVGSGAVSVLVGEAYTDTGAAAVDNVDGAVPVTSESTVDTGTPGQYTITYTATDRAGNTAQELRYVYVYDPLRVLTDGSTKILSEEAGQFNWSVDVDGNTAVVGFYADSSGAGFQGATYIFTRNEDDGWTQDQALGAPRSDIKFGNVVAVDGDTIILGRIGNETESGQVYVYTRSGETWALQQQLSHPEPILGDHFGRSVALDDDTMIVGGKGIHAFIRDGNAWSHSQEIIPDDAFDIGRAVALDGNTIVIGSHRDAEAVGIQNGAAYLYTRTGETWAYDQKLMASDADIYDWFGWSVALDGDTIAVGAHLDNNENGVDSGAVYVFQRTDATWSQQAKLMPPAGDVRDYFGRDIDIDGNVILVGSAWDDGSGNDSGTSHMFQRSGDAWNHMREIKPIDGEPVSLFGWSVAVNGNTAIVGAPFDDDGGYNAGSSYIFDLSLSSSTDAVLSLTPPSPVLGQPLSISVEDHDQNTDAGVAETLTVDAQNTSTGGTVETLTLTETGVDTGIFEGTLNTVDAAGDDGLADGSVNVQVDDVVQVTYTDELTVAGPPADRTDSVTFSAPLNGTDTVGAFYPSTGVWYLRDENSAGGPTVPSFTYGRGGVPVVGDWNNDGIDTVGAFYPSTGVWYLRDENSQGVPTVPSFTYGRGGLPVVGDWNNDGIDTVGVFYPSTGVWYLRDENSAGGPTVPSFTYGRGGVPVVGDWNNDGIDTVGVFYPSTGVWYLRDENSQGVPTVPAFTYGKGGVPVAGDWNSDGTDTVGVFYPSTGVWYLRDINSAGQPTVPSFTYGKGSRPVVGDWDNDGSVTPLSVSPGIAALNIVNADTGQLVAVIESGVTLTDLPQNVQIVAKTYSGDTVVFDYQGVEDFATDTEAPFTLTGDVPTVLASGEHTLTATLYADGVQIDSQTIRFTVE